MLTQIADEIKCSKKILFLGVIISSAVICVAVIFFNLTEYLMPEIYSNYDKQLEDGVKVSVNGLKLNQLDIIKKSGAENINVATTGSDTFYNSSLLDENNNLQIYCKDYIWLSVENCEENDINIPEDFSMNDFNMSTNAIIYCTPSETNNYNIGDTLVLSLENGNVVENYTIIEIIEDDSIEETSTLLPAVSVILANDKEGYSISYSVSCIYPSVQGYMEFKKELAKQDIVCKSDIDEVSTLAAALNIVFKIMAVVFIAISVLVIVVLTIININTRERFLILQKVLGSSELRIVSIHTVILELQIVISDVIGGIGGYAYTNYLINILGDLYSMEVKIRLNLILLIISGIVISNIALIPCVFIIKRIINKKDIVMVINNKE